MNQLADSRWRVRDDAREVTGEAAVALLRARGAGGPAEIWFERDDGRLMSVTSNGERAMVMLLRESGDPGEHAIDPGASGEQDGYVLSNGQNDVYPDHDTIPLATALRVVEHVIDRGQPPSDVEWQVDRGPE